MNVICWGFIVALFTAGASPAADAPLVVVDPGHGGTNTGAPGVGGVYEKRATLAMGRCVAARLRARGVRVRLTRDDDRYLSLRQRGRIANELGADRFVSIHFNATEDHDQRGFETFILTPRAPYVAGRALRTRVCSRWRLHISPSTAAGPTEGRVFGECSEPVKSGFRRPIRRSVTYHEDNAVPSSTH